MSQSEAVSTILERITQETAQVTTQKKKFGMKSKRSPKSPKIIADNTQLTNTNNTELSISPANPSLDEQEAKNICSSPNPSIVDSQNQFFDSQWSIISNCIDFIFDQCSEGKFEPAYQAVEILSQNETFSMKMYDLFLQKADFFSQLIINKFQSSLSLQSLTSIWDYIQRSNALLISIFSTFDRLYLSSKLESIEQIILKQISIALKNHPEILNCIFSLIIETMDKEREEFVGNFRLCFPPEELLVPSKIIEKLNLSETFIPILASKTKDFYSRIDFSKKNPCDFSNEIYSIIKSEQVLVSYFGTEVEKAHIASCRACLYIEKFHKEMTSILQWLLNNQEYRALQFFINLVYESADTALINSFVKSFSVVLQERCEEILSISATSNNDDANESKKKNKLAIPLLLKLQKFLSKTLQGIVMKDHLNLIMRSFKNGINEASFKLAFLLAKFCHRQIEKEPEFILRKIKIILMFIRGLNSIDAFLQHYKEFFAIRILTGISRFGESQLGDVTPEAISKMAELLLMNEIGDSCGDNYLSDMRKMIMDAQTSYEQQKNYELHMMDKVPIEEEMMANFSQSKQENHYPKTDSEFEELFKSRILIKFQVIDKTIWPFIQEVTSIPNQIKRPFNLPIVCGQFETLFRIYNPRKEFSWAPLFDTVEMKLNGSKIFGSSLYFYIIQSIIESKNFSEIGIGEEILKDILQSLVKKRIIENDMNNNHYSICQNLPEKVKLPIPQFYRPKQMEGEAIDNVSQFRRTRIMSVLVSKMKKLRVTTEEELYNELQETATYNTSLDEFNQCIQNLITREFINRNETGKLVFNTF